MKMLYWVLGALMYLIFILFITRLLSHNAFHPDRRAMNRRQNTDDRRKALRSDSGACRRMADRRTGHEAIPT